jgi:hypothetical protein
MSSVFIKTLMTTTVVFVLALALWLFALWLPVYFHAPRVRGGVNFGIAAMVLDAFYLIMLIGFYPIILFVSGQQKKFVFYLLWLAEFMQACFWVPLMDDYPYRASYFGLVNILFLALPVVASQYLNESILKSELSKRHSGKRFH